jgi:hypothetical protein
VAGVFRFSIALLRGSGDGLFEARDALKQALAPGLVGGFRR